MAAIAPTMDLTPELRMAQAGSYEEWRAAAEAEDERSGAARWKAKDESRRYDYKVIRRRLEELREVRASGDPTRLLFYLSEGIHGNTGGMGASSLYRRARFGTKDLVTAYSRELAGAIEQVASLDADAIGPDFKREFFQRASLCFGRTALMFSGGGILGLFHVGVARALLEQGLLPNVISGSSAGAIVAAILGTHRDEELKPWLNADSLQDAFEGLFEASVDPTDRRRRLGVAEIKRFIAERIPDLTFYEAFERTGRRINISVSPRELHQQARLLNAITSPTVLLREAVLASSAIPGIFPPVTLAARGRDGERRPYVASRQWVDGSVTNDLPARQLTRLYGVNHFVTSQVNPVVLWSLRDTDVEDTLFGRLWEIGTQAARQSLRATYPLSMKLTERAYPANLFVRMFYGVVTQDYTADINILPRRRTWNPTKLLSVLSANETEFLIAEGEAATWPRIERIRNCTRVSRALDAGLARLGVDAAIARA
jgi:TAG lipase / steryl ester hydrolase / phospholipase A2 / LPA acyltransferase